ncbi:hypothetical protein [Anaerorhabdus sp.]|uniref:hypothetical protein n=1 Tax=Anaerorhabdus sp. TaxID=1872524 RepID=UPI002FC9F499
MEKEIIGSCLLIALVVIGYYSQSIQMSNTILKSSQSCIIKCNYTASNTECYRVDFANENEIQELANTLNNQRLFPNPFQTNSHAYPLTTYHLITNENEEWIELYSDNTLLVDGKGYFSFDFDDLFKKIEKSYMSKVPVKV